MVREPRASVQGLAQRLEAIAEVHGSRTGGGYCGTTQGLWSINQKQYSFILGPWSLAQGPKLLDRNFHPGEFSFGFLPLCKMAVRPSRRSTQYPSHRWSIFFKTLDL